MKKLMIALALATVSSVAVNAQTTSFEAPSKYSVATNMFRHNWYVQASFDMSLANPYEANKWIKNSWSKGKSFGVNLAVGKWFTPGIGTRVKLGWENGMISSDHNVWTPRQTAGGFADLFFDTQFNLSNLICGYKESRVWNTIVYPRLGLLRNFDTSYYGPLIGFGWENSWKVAKKIRLFVDAAYNVGPSEIFEGTAAFAPSAAFIGTPVGGGPASKGRFGNGWLQVDLGIQFDLGKNTWEKAISIEDYNALAASSEAALAKLRNELQNEKKLNDELRKQLAARPVETKKVVDDATIVSGVATSVFFDLNSTKINSPKDLVNLESLASAAKKANAHIIVTGSADSRTGQSKHNQELSEGRANAVADKLVELGVPRSNIEVRAVGGIDEVSPYPLNRRALVFVR